MGNILYMAGISLAVIVLIRLVVSLVRRLALLRYNHVIATDYVHGCGLLIDARFVSGLSRQQLYALGQIRYYGIMLSNTYTLRRCDELIDAIMRHRDYLSTLPGNPYSDIVLNFGEFCQSHETHYRIKSRNILGTIKTYLKGIFTTHETRRHQSCYK